MGIVIWLVAAQSLVKYFSTLTENIHVYVAMHVNEHVHKKKYHVFTIYISVFMTMKPGDKIRKHDITL